VDVNQLRNMTVAEIRQQILAANNVGIFFLAGSAAGAPTQANPIGNVPRNFLRGDGLVSIDFSAVKDIKIVEGHTLQFRADMFNLPNHRNFGIPLATANSTAATFLNEKATDGGNRRIFMGLKYTF